MNISRLPSELLVRIFLLGSLPDESLEFTRHQLELEARQDGLHLYGIAATSVQVCSHLRSIIKNESSLHYLKIHLTNCNPESDRCNINRLFYGGDGVETEMFDVQFQDQEVEDDPMDGSTSFDRKFKDRLDAAKVYPNCDIHLNSPTALGRSQQLLPHFEALPAILIRYGHRLKVFRCCLLDWSRDISHEKGSDNILLALFGGDVMYPRLEFLHLLWPDITSFADGTKRQIRLLHNTVAMPNLKRLVTNPSPWDWMDNPIFTKVESLQVEVMGESMVSKEPRMWKWVNTQPKLHALSINWLQYPFIVSIPIHDASYCTIIPNISSLCMCMPDVLGWPIFFNIWLPNLTTLDLCFYSYFGPDAIFFPETLNYSIFDDRDRPAFTFHNLKSLALCPLHEASLEFLAISRFPLLESFTTYDEHSRGQRILYDHQKAEGSQSLLNRFRMPALQNLSLQADTIFMEWFVSRLNKPLPLHYTQVNDRASALEHFELNYFPQQSANHATEEFDSFGLGFRQLNPTFFYNLKSLHVCYGAPLKTGEGNQVVDVFKPILMLDTEHAPSLEVINISLSWGFSDEDVDAWSDWFASNDRYDPLVSYMSRRWHEAAPIYSLCIHRIKRIPQEKVDELCKYVADFDLHE